MGGKVRIELDAGWAAFGGAVGGALITASFAVVASWLTARNQLKLERLNDERRLRDLKRERVRSSAKALLATAFTMNDILIDQDMLRKGESEEERDLRLNSLWQRTTENANDAILELSLDLDTDDIIKIFDEIRHAFSRYQSARSSHLEDRHSVKWPHEEATEVRAGVAQLKASVREHLAELDRVI